MAASIAVCAWRRLVHLPHIQKISSIPKVAPFSNGTWVGSYRHVTDWTCPTCNKNCFSSTKVCFNCQTPRYSDARTTGSFKTSSKGKGLLKQGKNNQQHKSVKKQTPHERAQGYSKVIKSCGRNWREALTLLQKMEKEEGGLHITAVNAAITSCGKGGNWKKSLQLLEDLKENKLLEPNIVTFNTVISTLAKSAEYEQAEKVFHSLKSNLSTKVLSSDKSDQGGSSRYPVPNMITYNSMLSAYAASSKVEEMVLLLSEMEKGPKNTKPDTISYTTVIKGCIGVGDHKTATEVYDKMNESNKSRDGKFSPDIHAINYTLETFCKKGEWKGSFEFFIRSFSEKAQTNTSAICSPNVVSANALIGVLKCANRPKEALLLLQQMMGPVGGGYHFSVLDQSSSKQEQSAFVQEDVMRDFNGHEEVQKDDDNDEATLILEERFLVNHDSSFMKSVLRILEQANTRPNNDSFEKVITCLDEAGFVEDAAQLMEVCSRVSRFNHLPQQETAKEEVVLLQDGFKLDLFKNKIWLSNGSINLCGYSLGMCKAVLACVVNDLRHEVRPPGDIFISTDSILQAEEVLSILSKLNGPLNAFSRNLTKKEISNNKDEEKDTTKPLEKKKDKPLKDARIHIKQSDVVRWLGTKWGMAEFN